MKYIIIIIISLNAIFAQTDENQSFKLKDGTTINGTVIEENDDTYTIQTKYGSVTVKKNELVQKEYEINLKSGEIFSGMKLSETEKIIQLKTKVGVLNIEKTDILDIKEMGEVSQTESLSGPSESELYFMNKKWSNLWFKSRGF